MAGTKKSEGLAAQHREAAAGPFQKAGEVIDHLVAALAGDPSSPLRRALVLIDIARTPGTSQSAVMARLNVDKSSLTRDIEWLYNYGCITRTASPESGRENALSVTGFARTNLGFAAAPLDHDMGLLQTFVENYISFFSPYRPTLRDAKIVAALGGEGTLTRQDLFDHLYDGPVTTDTRSLLALIEEGIIRNDGTAANT